MWHERKGKVDVGLFLFIGCLAGGLALFFLAKNDSLLFLSMALLSLSFILGLIGSYNFFFSPRHKLRKIIQQMERNRTVSSIDTLKSEYNEAYMLYMKVSEASKQNFYGRVMKAREQVEELLKARKKVEFLLEKATMGSMEEWKKNFNELTKVWEQLPQKEKEMLLPKFMLVKEQVESGRG
ncbi:hypothetical protein J4421_00270 [Candidatus Woesearchaeota archaeon]|nr:hypothetical protein [Candidatus Woesearchaeota archaeon]